MTQDEEDLARANYLAHLYPIAIQGAGGAVINGKEYHWNYKLQRMELASVRKKREKK